MKKKLISAALAVLTAVSVAGCGSSAGNASSTAAASSAAPAASSVAAASEAASGSAAASTASGESDLDYVKNKGKLVVGITDFEPMDYKDADGKWIGFDADLANKFGESLGVDVEFVEINWDNKIMELNGKTIDCVWNGMTLTDEVTSSMSCTNAYLSNAQVVVLPKDVADQYPDVESLKDLNFAVESGSAGEAEINKLGYATTPVTSQADALMEVSAGTSDAAVIDSLMAAAMIGEGTSYENLTYTLSLSSEEYGVGFRQGSDLTEELNNFFKTCYEDGTMESVAEQYGVQAALIQQ